MEAGAGVILDRDARAAGGAARRARTRYEGCRSGRRTRAHASRRTFLGGREHGRARRVVRPAPGAPLPRRDPRVARDGASPRCRIPARLRRSRAGPVVPQGPAAVRRRPGKGGSAPAQVAHLSPGEHGLEFLPRRAAVRSRSRWRSGGRAAARARRPGGSGMGAGGRRVQGARASDSPLARAPERQSPSSIFTAATITSGSSKRIQWPLFGATR